MKEKTKLIQNSQILVALWGTLMHLFLILGVLDANFHSPIIPGLPVIPMPKGPPAKRVFIFVADGLRYRTFKDDIPPYINSVIQEQGVHGISHTRMPTESRPGNIAIVAGLYEDPSALFTGWKRNSVDFDHIFNQSDVSWLWGSPDIIPMFTKSGKQNIHGSSYPEDWQDFNKESNFMRLDDWVFDQYSNWLESSGSIEYKTADKMVIYFHLLGCDTIGHAAKPQSREYVDTMKNVDRIIKKVVELAEDKFEDKNSTAYILTADHGMTDWGSHGSGSTDETETPFVAWGAGVTKNERFFNIEQADITPLVSALAGISVPTNNEGTLPYEVLDPKHREYTSQAFLSNARQLAEQVKANRLLAIGDNAVNPYPKDREFAEILDNCEELLKDRNYDEFFGEMKVAAALAKESLSYYRRYQTNTYLYCLFLMWVGWIALLFVESSGDGMKRNTPWTIVPNAALTFVVLYFVVKYAVAGFKEWRLLGYGVIMAGSFWLAVVRGMTKKIPSFGIHSSVAVVEFAGVLVLVFMMFLGLIYRESLSVTMLLTVGLQKLMFDTNVNLLASGVILSVFPLLPVDKSQPRVYTVLLALVIAATSLLRNKKIHNHNKVLELVRIFLTSLMCTNVVDGRLWLSWFILVSTPISISLYPKDLKLRLFGVTAALLSPLALLSSSYEPLFFIIFSWNLQQWPIYEQPQRLVDTRKTPSLRDFSIAAFLMVYTLLSFFGTGNMASLSSFDPSWTRHFLTVFSPFTMKALILFKIATPLILVGFLIRALEKQTNSTIFSPILILADCLAVPLMFKVTNQGSWLDIGSSISRLVVAIGLPMILLVVYYLNNKVLTVSLRDFRALKSQRLKV